MSVVLFSENGYIFCRYNGNSNKHIIRLYWFVVLQSQCSRSPISFQTLYSILSTLLRSNFGEMLSNILKRVGNGVCFILANGETPRSLSCLTSLSSCFFAFASIIQVSHSTYARCQPRPASCIPRPSIPFSAQQGCQSIRLNLRNRLHRVR